MQHQQHVIKWSQQPYIRDKWPELRLLHHIPNERQCSPALGMQLKLAGVRRGVPDLHLPVPRGEYAALWLEMKTGTGVSSAEQEWWIRELNASGSFAEICHGWESAVRVIEWYMGLGDAGSSAVLVDRQNPRIEVEITPMEG